MTAQQHDAQADNKSHKRTNQKKNQQHNTVAQTTQWEKNSEGVRDRGLGLRSHRREKKTYLEVWVRYRKS